MSVLSNFFIHVNAFDFSHSHCIQQILESVQHCHQNEVVHRDLKVWCTVGYVMYNIDFYLPISCSIILLSESLIWADKNLPKLLHLSHISFEKQFSKQRQNRVNCSHMAYFKHSNVENTSEINPNFYEEPCDYMFMTLTAKFFGHFLWPSLLLPTSEIHLAINLYFFLVFSLSPLNLEYFGKLGSDCCKNNNFHKPSHSQYWVTLPSTIEKALIGSKTVPTR